MAQNFPSAESITIASNAIAVAISEGLNLEQQNILGNLLTLVGASLLSIASINEANNRASQASSTPAASSSGVTSAPAAQPAGSKANASKPADG